MLIGSPALAIALTRSDATPAALSQLWIELASLTAVFRALQKLLTEPWPWLAATTPTRRSNSGCGETSGAAIGASSAARSRGQRGDRVLHRLQEVAKIAAAASARQSGSDDRRDGKRGEKRPTPAQAPPPRRPSTLALRATQSHRRASRQALLTGDCSVSRRPSISFSRAPRRPAPRPGRRRPPEAGRPHQSGVEQSHHDFVGVGVGVGAGWACNAFCFSSFTFAM